MSTGIQPVRSALSLAVAAAIVGAGAAPAQAEIEEITVTATKRAESMQDIALAVQAVGSEQLEQENIQSFADYVMLLPNVTAGGRGPGQNEIYIRGAAVDAINITVAESQGSAPNVALYLDEQPVTAGGRNLDVYVTDMERIEVLPGPQGTLYGASSMAGTVRLITKKPVLDEFQASATGSWSTTSGGEDSNSLEAMVNIPIIEGKFAVRAALYNDNQGGYIDNVEGTFVADNSINPTFPGDTVSYPELNSDGDPYTFVDGTVVPAGGVTIPVRKTVASNSELTKDDFNTATYSGIRLGGKYLINDEWELLVQHTRQTLRTEGVFDYDPEVGDLKVSRFTEDSLDDFFSQTAWTLEGRLGALDVVYTGAFLDREVDAKLDYTGYTNIGKFIAGYQCEYLVGSFYNGIGSDADTTYFWDPTISGDPGVIECGNPANAVNLENELTRWTHEFRVSTDWDSPFSLQGGIFYENFEILHRGDFNYLAPFEAGFSPIDINTNSNLDNAAANARGVVTAGTQFRNDNTRTEEQFALFGEVSWDITETLNASMGFRYYDLEYGFKGYGAFRYGNRPLFVDDADPDNDIRPARTGGRDYAVNLDLIEPLKTDDTIVKFTVSWAPGGDSLFYATWSEGYRPPGFNRGAAAAAVYDPNANNTNTAGLECGPDIAINPNALTGFPGYCLPYVFESDTLENMEFGWKSTLANGNVQFNGSIYKIDWENIQVSQFDSQNISIFTLIDNGGDAEITGIEADLIWAASENWTLYASGSFNDTELVFVDPAFDIVVADAGSELPLTPDVQISSRARYDWELDNGWLGYGQLGFKYSGKSLNSLVDTPEEPNTNQDSWTVVNGSLGFEHPSDGWGAELFVQNLTDERAQLHINRQDFFERITTNRPRTIGLRFSYHF